MITEIAKRYAVALFEISKETKSETVTLFELQSVANSIEQNPKIRELFESPIFSVEEKIKTFQALSQANFSQKTIDFLKLLAEKGRLGLMTQVAPAFQIMIDKSAGVSRGEIRSASPLSAEEKKKIEETVAQKTKKKVALTFKEDPSLLGGIVAQVDGWTFDDTLETHLRRLNEELKRSAL